MNGGRVRIAITGIGAISPAGGTAAESWDALMRGCSAVAPIQAFAAAGARPCYAAEVKDLSAERIGVARRKVKMMGRQAQLAFAATHEAYRDAGLADAASGCARTRLGTVLGVGMLNADVDELARTLHTMHAATGNGFDTAAFNRAALAEMLPLWLLRHIPNLATAHASIALDAQGPSNTIATGCVAGANAIGEAARIIARGDADVVIAGGSDARVNPLSMLRFRELGWLSTRSDCPPEAVSAPFDESASGFVNGEAAAALVLESADHAVRRGARIRAELIAYSAANDAGGMTPPGFAGGAAGRVLTRCAQALAEAGSPRLDCVFAGASGFAPVDAATAAALQSLATRMPIGRITATRSAIGHTHAASAAVDAVMAVQALAAGEVPQVLNLTRPIAALPFAGGPGGGQIDTAVVAAQGFGGHAAALALRRWQA